MGSQDPQNHVNVYKTITKVICNKWKTMEKMESKSLRRRRVQKKLMGWFSRELRNRKHKTAIHAQRIHMQLHLHTAFHNVAQLHHFLRECWLCLVRFMGSFPITCIEIQASLLQTIWFFIFRSKKRTSYREYLSIRRRQVQFIFCDQSVIKDSKHFFMKV